MKIIIPILVGISTLSFGQKMKSLNLRTNDKDTATEIMKKYDFRIDSRKSPDQKVDSEIKKGVILKKRCHKHHKVIYNTIKYPNVNKKAKKNIKYTNGKTNEN